MIRYRAPAHISSITLSCGERTVRNGVIEVPDTIGEGDRIGLAANGFVPVPAKTDEKKG